MEKILAVDIGTSSIKAGIIDKNGILLSWQRTSYEESGGDVYNWQTGYWVNAFKKSLMDLPYLDQIDALVCSGSGPSIIPIDGNGRYIPEALIWIDKKKIDIPGEKSFFLPKIKWFKESRREIYSDISCFLPLSGFFPYLLTGELKAPVPNNEFSPFLWSAESAAASGIEMDKLPPFILTGELAGYVTEEGAGDSGIKKGVPVFAGGNDYLMALLGTGAVYEGAVCDRAGTSEGINYCSTGQSRCDKLKTLPHVISGFNNISGILASSGRIFEWFRKLSGQEDKSYVSLVNEISKVVYNDDHLYFFPSLKRDSVWQFSGGAFVGLEARHGMAETGSAVVKSIGFSVRDIIQYMEKCSLKIENVRLSGGQAKNPLWNQMKANMIGKTILVPEIHDGELLGCACAAFHGLGAYSSLSEASLRMVRIRDVYKPDRKAYDRFTRLFEDYSVISARIEKLADSL